MKTMLLAFLLGIAVGLGSVSAKADVKFHPAGPEVPFPLSAIVPFPWTVIEGTWETIDAQSGVIFSFRVQNDCNGQKILKVIQVDALEGEVIAEGAGFADTDQRIVRAVMRAKGYSYMLIVRAFKNAKAVYPPKMSMVLSVQPMAGNDAEESHFVLRKLSSQPYLF